MSDDFLTQIQNAETEAEKLVQNAREKTQRDVQNEKSKLQKKREENLEKVRTNSKKTLSEKQKEMRGLYDKSVGEGLKDAQSLEREAKPKIEKGIQAAVMHLQNELI